MTDHRSKKHTGQSGQSLANAPAYIWVVYKLFLFKFIIKSVESRSKSIRTLITGWPFSHSNRPLESDKEHLGSVDYPVKLYTYDSTDGRTERISQLLAKSGEKKEERGRASAIKNGYIVFRMCWRHSRFDQSCPSRQTFFCLKNGGDSNPCEKVMQLFFFFKKKIGWRCKRSPHSEVPTIFVRQKNGPSPNTESTIVSSRYWISDRNNDTNSIYLYIWMMIYYIQPIESLPAVFY